MAQPFEITIDDLENVLADYGQSLPPKELEAYFQNEISPRASEIKASTLYSLVKDMTVEEKTKHHLFFSGNFSLERINALLKEVKVHHPEFNKIWGEDWETVSPQVIKTLKATANEKIAALLKKSGLIAPNAQPA